MASHGIVVIGRNEGERLRRCLGALRGVDVPRVYVDSCSHDGSAAWALGQGLDVLELDGSQPLSAAWARKSPQLVGMLSYHYRTKWQKRAATLIEHKG